MGWNSRLDAIQARFDMVTKGNRQEDKDEAKAADTCFLNYGVTFTMLAPQHVKGPEANPVFQELAKQTKAPGWRQCRPQNFRDYLFDLMKRKQARSYVRLQFSALRSFYRLDRKSVV